MRPELNVLALFKGAERFLFVYDDDSREALVDDLRQKAADPAVALNWFDAAVLTASRHSSGRRPPPSWPCRDCILPSRIPAVRTLGRPRCHSG